LAYFRDEEQLAEQAVPVGQIGLIANQMGPFRWFDHLFLREMKSPRPTCCSGFVTINFIACTTHIVRSDRKSEMINAMCRSVRILHLRSHSCEHPRHHDVRPPCFQCINCIHTFARSSKYRILGCVAMAFASRNVFSMNTGVVAYRAYIAYVTVAIHTIRSPPKNWAGELDSSTFSSFVAQGEGKCDHGGVFQRKGVKSSTLCGDALWWIVACWLPCRHCALLLSVSVCASTSIGSHFAGEFLAKPFRNLSVRCDNDGQINTRWGQVR